MATLDKIRARAREHADTLGEYPDEVRFSRLVVALCDEIDARIAFDAAESHAQLRTAGRKLDAARRAREEMEL